MKLSFKTKKRALFIVLFGMFFSSWASDNYTGSALEGKRFAVFDPSLINVGSSEAVWLGESVKSYLNTQIKLYTGMTSVNIDNIDAIKQYQKKSESGLMDEDTAIEIGKMLNAQYGVFVKITKTDKTYMLSCVVTDLTTGASQASYDVRDINRSNDVYGMALNKLILNLVPQLGVNLTALGKYTLNNNTDDISIEQQIALNKQEIDSYSRQLSEMEKELDKYKTSETLKNQDMQNERAKLETEQNLLKQKQLQAEKRQRELSERQANEEKERLSAAERSEQTSSMIKNLSSSVEEAALKVRRSQFDEMTVEERIYLIENKKKTYIDINNQINAQIRALEEEADSEYKEVELDVDDISNYSKFDLYEEEGRILPNAESRQALIERNNKEKDRINKRLKSDVESITDSTNQQITALKKEIDTDLKNLGKKETASSLTDSGLFKVTKWNGKDRTWISEINICVGNEAFITEEVTISLSEIQKEFKSDVEGLTAQQIFEVFDSMFTMGTPVIYAEADYTVAAMSDKEPSCYRLSAIEYRLINPKTKKIFKTIVPDTASVVLQYSPANDMRTARQKELDEVKDTRQKELEMIEKAKAKKAKEISSQYSQLNGGGARTVLGFDLGGSCGLDKGTFVFDFNSTLGINPWSYVGFNVGSTPDALRDGQVFAFFMTLGLNLRIPLGTFYPDLYAEFGAGASKYSLGSNTLKNSSYNLDADAMDATLRYAVGLDIPIGNATALNFQYALVQMVDIGFFDRFTVGFMLSGTGSLFGN